MAIIAMERPLNDAATIVLADQDEEIHCATSRTLSDQIVKTARARLRDSRYNILAAVSCSCEHGLLLLRGRLPSFYLKQMAQESVAGVHGVLQVVNNISVSPAERSPPLSVCPSWPRACS